MRLDLLRNLNGLFVLDGSHLLLPQALPRGLVVSQIKLRANKNDGNAGRVMLNLGVPLGLDVVERRRADDGEADEEHVGLRVGQRAQTIVILLTSGIPQTQTDGLTVDHDVGRVVVEHCRDVLAGEGVGGIRDQKACLSDGTVAGDNALQGLRRGCSSHCGGVEVRVSNGDEGCLGWVDADVAGGQEAWWMHEGRR